MELIWLLLIGGGIGWLAGATLGRDIPGGVFGNIIDGFVGAFLGSFILGDWGLEGGNFNPIPALIGSIVLVLVIIYFEKYAPKSSFKEDLPRGEFNHKPELTMMRTNYLDIHSET
jgi:uncharacterized membrane protein YeaQ/YmgE (transglycosylase-associated protein family)